MSVLVEQLDSGGTYNWWTAALAAAMGGGWIVMDVVGGGDIGQRWQE